MHLTDLIACGLAACGAVDLCLDGSIFASLRSMASTPRQMMKPAIRDKSIVSSLFVVAATRAL